ncbi:MAG: universal stress protein [Exilibacterium sp.]
MCSNSAINKDIHQSIRIKIGSEFIDMPLYNHIVCAIDLTEDSNLVIQRALRLASHDSSRLDLVHACEHPITGYGEQSGKSHKVTEIQIRQSVFPQLEAFANRFGIHSEQLHIEFGRSADVIHALAERLGADLIVIGSHGRSGIRLLLGSTANSVVHGASCDVLTVRVQAKTEKC